MLVQCRKDIPMLNRIRSQNKIQTFHRFLKYHFIHSLLQIATNITKQIRIKSLIIDMFVCDIHKFNQYDNTVTMIWYSAIIIKKYFRNCLMNFCMKVG